MRDLTAVILDRPRHDGLIAEVRATGARIRLITDGDVAGAIATGWPGAGTDILFGIGGTPEGVLAAAALKCMGGEIQGRLHPRNEEERAAAVEAGYALDAVLTTDDLVQGNNCFFAATGHHRRRAPAGRPVPRVRRHDAVARDALQVGDAPQDRRQPRAGQVGRVQLDLVRLVGIRPTVGAAPVPVQTVPAATASRNSARASAPCISASSTSSSTSSEAGAPAARPVR